MTSTELPARERVRLEHTLQRIPSASQSILDCGGGVGWLAKLVAESCDPERVVLIDIAEKRISQARNFALPVAGSSATLPFPDRAFDCVVSTEMMEHLPLELERCALTEMQRVSSDHLVITVPYREDLHRSMVRCRGCGEGFHPHGHLRSYRHADIVERLSGFEVVEITSIGPRRFRAPGLIVWLARRTGLLAAPTIGEPCPSCGGLSAETGRLRITFGLLVPQWRRPWLLVHARRIGRN